MLTSMRSIRALALSALLAGCALLVAVAPAHATSGNCVYSGKAALMCADFDSHGEVFTVTDDWCDGHSVYIRWSEGGGDQPGGDTKRFDWHGGCGTATKLNLDLREGTYVQYVGCVNRQLLPDPCFDIIYDKA